MDVAVIDWKDSTFEKDSLYEDINAPQWIDFANADLPVDDESWFCKPDCNHPKTVEDFVRDRSPGSGSKVQRSAEISRSGDRNKRDAALKKRGLPPSKDTKSTKYIQDDENQNPNFSTPPVNKAKLLKEMIKSSSEKTTNVEHISLLQKEDTPRLLKSKSSARDLFAGRDILNHVTEFCNELKRLAIRVKDNGEKESAKKQDIGGLQKSQSQSESQRNPLLEVKQEKYEEIEVHNNVKEKLTKKKMNEDSENHPVTLNMKTIRSKEEKRLLQIRTNPPSPQCFSAKQKTTPLKAFVLRPQEAKKEVKSRIITTPSEQNEAKGLDVFWFLKPCTLSK